MPRRRRQPESLLPAAAAPAAPDPSAEWNARAVVIVLFAITAAMLGMGIYWLRDWIGWELRRREPWRVATILISEALSVWWFLQFFIARCILRRSFIVKQFHLSRYWRVWGAFFLSCTVGFAADIGFTLWDMHVDYSRFESATVTAATVDSVSSYKSGGIWRTYDIHCTYPDAQGRRHEGKFTLSEDESSGVLKGVELLDTKRRILAGRVPFELPVRYDPGWPARSWLDGVDYDEQLSHGGILWSLNLAIFQLVGLEIVILLAWRARGASSVSWEFELAKFFPLMCEAVILAVAGYLGAHVFVP